MDMKKILQAMDGVATKPVVGSDSMARFLRVVKEAELNQKTAPVTKPVPSKPVAAPSGNLTADEMVSILSGQKTQAQIMADREAKKADPGVKEGLVDGSGNPVSSGGGQPVQTAQAAAPAAPSKPAPAQYQVPSVDFLKKNYKHPADIISGSHPSTTDPTRIGAWEGTSDFAELMMALNGSYYQARQADPNYKQPAFVKDDWELVQRMLGTPEGKEYAIANWIGLSDVNDTSPEAEFNRAQHKEFEKQANAKILAQKSDVIKPGWKYDQELGMTPAQAELQAQKAKQQPAAPKPVSEGLSKFLSIVRKNDVSILKEGANPHKVALPVQMAMQHYQTPVKQAINETSSVFKTYVALVEDDISEKKIAKQQLIRQYSQRIAEAVLMKERVVGGEETPPGINRLTGKPNPPEAAPTDAPAVVPLGKRFDPRFKNGPEPYTIDIDGVVYKFAGRTATGPGTGEVIKVPAAVIGIRGLSAVSVELGKDGMYYPAPATNESKNIKR